jgi:hypothetical protein
MFLQALLESRDPLRCRDRVTKRIGRLGKGKIVDHVNEQKDAGECSSTVSCGAGRFLFIKKLALRDLGTHFFQPGSPLPRRSGHANRRSPF